MVKRKKACIFISGAGTNLKSIIKNSRDYNFPININLVISNNKNAVGILYAKKFAIPYLVLDKGKNSFEKFALKELIDKKINLLCLAGFMKILSKRFIRTFKRVLNAKEKITGCTVHFVNEKLDGGNSIIKKRVLINKNDDEEILKKRVQLEEYKAYSIAIRKVFSF